MRHLCQDESVTRKREKWREGKISREDSMIQGMARIISKSEGTPGSSNSKKQRGKNCKS